MTLSFCVYLILTFTTMLLIDAWDGTIATTAATIVGNDIVSSSQWSDLQLITGSFTETPVLIVVRKRYSFKIHRPRYPGLKCIVSIKNSRH